LKHSNNSTATPAHQYPTASGPELAAGLVHRRLGAYAATLAYFRGWGWAAARNKRRSAGRGHSRAGVGELQPVGLGGGERCQREQAAVAGGAGVEQCRWFEWWEGHPTHQTSYP